VLDLIRVTRQEEVTDGILASLGQGDALLCHFLAEELVGDLQQNAGTIAHQRISTDGAAMGEVFQNEQAVLDDLVRLLALHMGDEADAAGIVLVARVVKPLRCRNTGGNEWQTLFDARASLRRGCGGGQTVHFRNILRHCYSSCWPLTIELANGVFFISPEEMPRPFRWQTAEAGSP